MVILSSAAAADATRRLSGAPPPPCCGPRKLVDDDVTTAGAGVHCSTFSRTRTRVWPGQCPGLTVDLCKGSMPAALSPQSADAVCPPVGDQVTTDAGQCLGGVYTGQGRCWALHTAHWSCHTPFIPYPPPHTTTTSC